MLVKKVCNYGQNRDAFKRKCELARKEDELCEILELMKVVATRWNSYGSYFIRFWKLQSAISRLCSDRTLPAFCRYQMSNTEWDIIEEIQPILKVCFILIFKHLLTIYSDRYSLLQRSRCLGLKSLSSTI